MLGDEEVPTLEQLRSEALAAEAPVRRARARSTTMKKQSAASTVRANVILSVLPPTLLFSLSFSLSILPPHRQVWLMPSLSLSLSLSVFWQFLEQMEAADASVIALCGLTTAERAYPRQAVRLQQAGPI